MLYLVKPAGQSLCTHNVGEELLDIARAANKDLGAMTEWWEPSERANNDDDVRVALRYGLAATGGIVVAAIHVERVGRPNMLRTLAAESSVRTAAYNDLPQVKVVDDYLESMMPGWKAAGVKTDAGVANSLRRSLREAEKKAAGELARPVDRDLVLHWQILGGAVPHPT